MHRLYWPIETIGSIPCGSNNFSAPFLYTKYVIDDLATSWTRRIRNERFWKRPLCHSGLGNQSPCWESKVTIAISWVNTTGWSALGVGGNRCPSLALNQSIQSGGVLEQYLYSEGALNRTLICGLLPKINPLTAVRPSLKMAPSVVG